MKKSKEIPLSDMPHEVLQAYSVIYFNQFVGIETWEKVQETIKKHPEYFKEYIESQRRWDAIPNSVHKAYNKELSEGINVIEEKYNPGYIEKMKKQANKGLINAVRRFTYSPKEFTKESFDKMVIEMTQKPVDIQNLKDTLNKKYYEPYGVSKD